MAEAEGGWTSLHSFLLLLRSRGLAAHSDSQLHTGQGGAVVRRQGAVVVVASWKELEAQREGREALDFLREPDGSQGVVGFVALPALHRPFCLLAALKLALGHQVQSQRLRGGGRRVAGGVVRTQDVQVVVEVHLDGVVVTREPGVGGVPVDNVSLG